MQGITFRTRGLLIFWGFLIFHAQQSLQGLEMSIKYGQPVSSSSEGYSISNNHVEQKSLLEHSTRNHEADGLQQQKTTLGPTPVPCCENYLKLFILIYMILGITVLPRDWLMG